MKISAELTDNAILKILGHRVAAARIRRNLTQAALAEAAGIAKRTLEGIEAGRSPRLLSLIRVLRVLDLVDGLEVAVPEVAPSPLERWKSGKSERRRASSKRRESPPGEWQWGDGA